MSKDSYADGWKEADDAIKNQLPGHKDLSQGNTPWDNGWNDRIVHGTKMNPELKAEWVAALRSGNYVQGKGVLRTVSNKFCCLGVACDVLVKRGIGEWVLDEKDACYKYSINSYRNGFALSEAAMKALGIPLERHSDVEIPDSCYPHRTLTRRNDSEEDEWDFDRIANLIEKEL